MVRRTSAGIEVESRGPLAGIGAGPLLPHPRSSGSAVSGRRRARLQGHDARKPVMPMNNLKQIGLAMHKLRKSTYGTFPPAYIADKATGKPLLSWRVAILPYLERRSAVTSSSISTNRGTARTTSRSSPACHPSIAARAAPASAGKTRYVTLRHKDSAFPGKDGVRPADITHGTVQHDPGRRSRRGACRDLDQARRPGIRSRRNRGRVSPGSPPRGFNAAFCDGSVRFIQDSIDSEFLQDMANRHGGKPATKR